MRTAGRAWLIGGPAVALAALAVVAALPRYASVDRTVVIAAPPATVYELLADLTAVRRWSPWRDARSHYLFSGPRVGAGAHMEWSGQSRGRTTIEAAEPYRHVAYRFVLEGEPRLAEVRLTPKGQGVAVAWRLQRDAGFNPLLRLANLWFAWREGPDLERGLERLADSAEALPKANMAAAQVRLVQRPTRVFAYVTGRTRATPQAVAAALARGVRQLDGAVGKQALKPSSGPVWIADPPDAGGTLSYRIGLTLTHSPSAPLGAGVSLGELAGGSVIEATHTGPIWEAEQVRAAARLYRGIHQLASVGPARLEFLSDPGAPELKARFEFPVATPGADFTNP